MVLGRMQGVPVIQIGMPENMLTWQLTPELPCLKASATAFMFAVPYSQQFYILEFMPGEPLTLAAASVTKVQLRAAQLLSALHNQCRFKHIYNLPWYTTTRPCMHTHGPATLQQLFEEAPGDQPHLIPDAMQSIHQRNSLS